jgi:hypothetical protein
MDRKQKVVHGTNLDYEVEHKFRVHGTIHCFKGTKI